MNTRKRGRFASLPSSVRRAGLMGTIFPIVGYALAIGALIWNRSYSDPVVILTSMMIIAMSTWLLVKTLRLLGRSRKSDAVLDAMLKVADQATVIPPGQAARITMDWEVFMGDGSRIRSELFVNADGTLTGTVTMDDFTREVRGHVRYDEDGFPIDSWVLTSANGVEWEESHGHYRDFRDLIATSRGLPIPNRFQNNVYEWIGEDKSTVMTIDGTDVLFVVVDPSMITLSFARSLVPEQVVAMPAGDMVTGEGTGVILFV